MAQPGRIQASTARAFGAPSGCKEIEMLDALMLVAGVAFFVIAIAYVTACDHM
jgi:hypothetical protein